jgi:hypothetical protein
MCAPSAKRGQKGINFSLLFNVGFGGKDGCNGTSQKGRRQWK